jgi:hypothetical protein
MPLSGAEQAAWAGVLSARRGGKALPTAVQTALVAFFAENDLSVAEYWPVDVNDVDWQDEWREFMTGAAMTKDFQVGAVLRWVEARNASTAPSTHRAAAIFKTLEDGGLELPSGMRPAIEAAVNGGIAGDKHAQSTCFEFVCILYCGQLLGDLADFKGWWSAQRAAMQQDGRVRIRAYAEYAKLHKNTTVPTLERALQDMSGYKFDLYSQELKAMLAAADLPLAVAMFTEVVDWAKRQYSSSTTFQVRYLQMYFFGEYEGLGCPQKVSADGKDLIERLKGGAIEPPILIPTAPEEAKAMDPAASRYSINPWAGSLAPSLDVDSLGQAMAFAFMKMGGGTPTQGGGGSSNTPVLEDLTEKACSFCGPTAFHDVRDCPKLKKWKRLEQEDNSKQKTLRVEKAEREKVAAAAAAAGLPST